MDTNELRSKNSCCGCGVCKEICPKQAITMECDEYGFVYPVIDKKKCIDCGLCKQKCSFGNATLEQIKECYAAVNVNEHELMKSSSGGVFASIASEFLKEGSVCGVKIVRNANSFDVAHKLIQQKAELYMLQGSKYVQSHMWHCVSDIKSMLETGRKVLFSGTPCQVAAIKDLYKKYVGTQLFTIDLICHGVPSQKMFNDYLQQYQNDNGVRVEKYDFRNKKCGWGANGIMEVTNEDQMRSEIKITSDNASYYHFFYKGDLSRESCYECPYACQNRVGDVTIGDYWGIETFNPELLSENGGSLDRQRGVSCLLINNQSGKELIERYGKNLQLYPIDFNNIAVYNTQLREPVKPSKLRKKIFDAYLQSGYSGVDRIYVKRRRMAKLKTAIKSIIPSGIKKKIKKVLYK